MSCPGKTERWESSSGAPKKIDGIKSRKVCVIDIATMKTTKIIGDIGSRIEVVVEIIITEIRFICIPGIRPVRVPAVIPRSKDSMNCII